MPHKYSSPPFQQVVLFDGRRSGIMLGLVEGLAIGNMASQDKRDEAILEELRKLNKDE